MDLYADGTFAKAGFSPTSGVVNTYTAIATDSLSRSDTNSVSVWVPGTVTFVYDQNGNLTSDGQRSFVYDDENQLIEVSVANSWKSGFAYDGKMRRRIRTEATWSGSAWMTNTIVRYIYDGNLVLQERDENNFPRVTYTRGLDLSRSVEGAGGIGGLLARTDHSTLTPTHVFYHADGNGNITALQSQQQQVVARYLYDPFGNTLSIAGPTASANLMRFSSKEAHEKSGLYYYGYRFYEPNSQRWLNRDPIGEIGAGSIREASATSESWQGDGLQGSPDTILAESPLGAPSSNGINPYTFVFNNPMSYVDPAGEYAWGVIIREGIKAELARRAKRAGQCVAIHAQYKAVEEKARKCVPGMSREEAAKNCALWSAVVAGRSLYLSKKCDYYLPGSIAAGSKKSEAGHRAAFAAASAAMATCCACALPEK